VLLPWMPKTLERFDLSGYDVVLSSSHAIGKGIIPPSTARHICYCHTPVRYGWEMEEEYLRDSKIPRIFWKPIKKQLKKLRRWDMTTAKRVDQFIANSTAIANRIKKIYNRDAIVIHPPVADRFFSFEPELEPENRSKFLAIGRLVPYKRFDLLIELSNKYKIPLEIAGTGPDESRLKRLAGPMVTFLGFVPDSDLPRVYAQAKALLYPQEEDAGIAPLEAQACGTPVIALGKGGALDTVKENDASTSLGTGTGVFFREQTVESLKDAIDRFEGMTFEPEVIREHAEQFSAERFRGKITQVISKPSY